MRFAVRGALLLVMALSPLSDAFHSDDGKARGSAHRPATIRGAQGTVPPSLSTSPALPDDPIVIAPVTPSVSPAVRTLPHVVARPDIAPSARRRGERDGLLSEPIGPGRPPDQLAGAPSTGVTASSPLASFEGLSTDDISPVVAPPDPVGDVGPNHYVQMVNSAFAIFDKNTGAILSGPFNINSLWSGTGSLCELTNDGDPIVLYDHFADRWLLSQFTVSFYPNGQGFCIAVSQTPDPTGAYYLYGFTISSFPDYPKFGIWPDAYFITTNTGFDSYIVWTVDRLNMLAGNSAGGTGFGSNTNFPFPADADGPTAPPAGSPGFFFTFKDDVYHGGEGTGLGDRIEIYEFEPDFVTLGNSTFGLVQAIPITAFNHTVCGFFPNTGCIPQSDVADSDSWLDAISEWPMHRLQYRNFGTHETMVGNFTVDVSGSNQAGIRWFELRRSPPGSGSWTLHQEGTHAPDTTHRWMGSIAMDGQGNIGLGYSVSNADIHPGLRYTGRLPGDPLGSLRLESSLIEGTGSQVATASRWGDYSSLNVDPVDDKTFWYTGEYYETTGSFDWRTRIGKFKVEPDLFVSAYALLQGPYGSGSMATTLATSGVVPTSQPFSGAPWSYAGGESVVAVGDSVVDWVLLSLLSGDPSDPPMILESQRAALLVEDGSIVDTSGFGPVFFPVSPDSSYYLVVAARNHLPVMSSGSLSAVAESAMWDFTTSDTQAYSSGGPALGDLGGGDFGLFACDIDQDGQITASDFNLWLTDTKAAATGYLATDCDLDAQVIASDFNVWLVNTKAAYQSQVPPF